MRSSLFSRVTDKLWNLLAFRYLPSLLLLLIAALAFAFVLTAQPYQVSESWWTIPIRNGTLVAVIVTIAFVALSSWFASLFSFVSRRKKENGKTRWSGRVVGVIVVVCGISTIAADWFIAQQTIPAARVTIPQSEIFESYPTESTDFSANVMLPEKVQLRSFRPKEKPPVVDLVFGQEKEGENSSQPVRVYEPLLVNGNYWTLVGMEYSSRVLRALITPVSEDAISAAGGVGDKIHFTVNGPVYTIKSIHLDSTSPLGPYVELEDESGLIFNVYEKPKADDSLPENQVLPTLNDGFWLTKVDASPLATLLISPDPPVEMLLPALLAVLIGLVLLIVSSDNSILLGIRIGSEKQEENQ